MSARKQSGQDGDEAPRKASLADHFFRLSLTCLIFVVVLYAAAHLIVRTDGFRSILGEKLSDRLAVPIEMTDARLSWRLSPVLHQVTLASDGEVTLERVVAKWGFRGYRPVVRRVGMRANDVVLQRDKEGTWHPLPLAWLGRALWAVQDLEEGDETAELTMGRMPADVDLSFKADSVTLIQGDRMLKYVGGLRVRARSTPYDDSHAWLEVEYGINQGDGVHLGSHSALRATVVGDRAYVHYLFMDPGERAVTQSLPEEQALQRPAEVDENEVAADEAAVDTQSIKESLENALN